MLRRKKQGTALIDEVADRFTIMIEELDQGIVDCASERESIQEQIKVLNQQDLVLNASIHKAKTIASNLRQLIGI